MKIGLIQQHNTSDREDNISRLENSIRQLKEQGAQIVVMQELHNSLYTSVKWKT